MRFIPALFLLFLLSGCGSIQRYWTSWTGGVTFKCVRGITFVQSDSGFAWLPDESGKPVKCNKDD